MKGILEQKSKVSSGRTILLFHCNLLHIPKMTTIVQVKEAIAALKDRTGSSVVAISKWLESEKKVSVLAKF